MYGKKWRKGRRLEPPSAVEPGNDRAYSGSPPRDRSVGRDRQGNRRRHPRKSEIVFITCCTLHTIKGGCKLPNVSEEAPEMEDNLCLPPQKKLGFFFKTPSMA